MHTCTYLLYFFFFNDTATTEIYTLSLHDALPISAIHGAAPTWVKIENVLHEFSHLPGVQEDTLDIMMNLRKVVFALHVNRPKILRLKAQGTRVAKAGDFEPDADVQILTPDVVLATLDKDGVLEMEVCIERG